MIVTFIGGLNFYVNEAPPSLRRHCYFQLVIDVMRCMKDIQLPYDLLHRLNAVEIFREQQNRNFI